jgi:hypothetical protein
MAQSPRPNVAVRWVRAPNETTASTRYVVEVTGISASSIIRLEQENRFADLLSIYVLQQSSTEPAPSVPPPDLPSMLGEYTVVSGVLQFKPGFSLSPGVTYLAVARPQVLKEDCSSCGDIVTRLEVPRVTRGPSTFVSQVFPSGAQVPENLLKFYVHFSAPMSRGRVYDFIHLKDESGRKVDLPFLEINEELWDDAMQRLTLIIDPGRIKRGVKPLEDVGPALEEGKRYTLSIDSRMVDGVGWSLKNSFEKVFTVGPPDRTPPDPAQWKIETPKAGTRDPLVVSFAEALDNAITKRVIHVITGAGGPALEGTSTMGQDERSWHFVPNAPWRGGAHNLVIEKTLEDLAGNNIGKPFDVDLFDGIDRKRVTGTYKLPFVIGM